MAKVVLKVTINPVVNPPFPNPQIGDFRVFSDDIIEINGKTIAPGVSQHSGFCFVVRQNFRL